MSPSAAEPTTLYFAYGSNMHRTQMHDRCPRTTLLGNASVGGWRFMINARTYATIVPDDRAIVHGLLWTLTPSDESALDRYEGVARGLYDKQWIVVRAEDGQVEAMVYMAADSSPGVPEAEYFLRIIVGAKDARLPADYVAELETWKPKGL